MKRLFKVFSILIVVTIYLFANSLEDEAFRAYKSKDYKKAFKLYTTLAKEDNLKSFLMLGLFFEKGIGVKEDKTKAKKLYKHILKRISNTKDILTSKDYKRVEVAIIALKRLYALSGREDYLRLAKKFTKLKENINIENSELFSSTKSQNVDDFLILCPSAKVVAPEDREGLETFDCDLFENFPKRMALFMKLRRLRFEAMQDRKSRELLRKIDAKLARVVKPMIEFLQQEVVTCYTNAQTTNDIYSCNYDYLSKSDPLLFRNYSYKMEQYLSRHKYKNHKLDIFEKEDLVDSLVTKIAKGEFGKNWEDMVK